MVNNVTIADFGDAGANMVDAVRQLSEQRVSIEGQIETKKSKGEDTKGLEHSLKAIKTAIRKKCGHI